MDTSTRRSPRALEILVDVVVEDIIPVQEFQCGLCRQEFSGLGEEISLNSSNDSWSKSGVWCHACVAQYRYASKNRGRSLL
jgi:hypothetical protein